MGKFRKNKSSVEEKSEWKCKSVRKIAFVEREKLGLERKNYLRVKWAIGR